MEASLTIISFGILSLIFLASAIAGLILTGHHFFIIYLIIIIVSGSSLCCVIICLIPVVNDYVILRKSPRFVSYETI